MVKKVACPYIESRLSQTQAIIGDSTSQMGFTTAAWTEEYEPAFRVSSKAFGSFIGAGKVLLGNDIPLSSCRQESSKGKMGKGS